MMSRRLPITRWQLRHGNDKIQQQLVKEFRIHPIIAKIITSRDLRDLGKVHKYLFPSLNDLHNPFLMQDMKKAVGRMARAIHNREKIVIYGDYDADGITSVAILLIFLRRIHDEVNYYIPDRISEGYGLNRNAVERLHADGVSLIITVDCGVSDHEAIDLARRLGMDTIVLDHHAIPETLPNALAVVNPHRTDCKFPFKDLAAVGIVFNFLIALRGALRQEGYWANNAYPNLRDFLDLVALGTIGDIVPLVDENRIFAKIGLELITAGRRVGIAALKEISGIGGYVVDSGKASFSLIPRINAAGRIASANEAVELLLTEDQKKAYELARRLDAFNRKRQTIEKAIFNELMEKVGNQPEPSRDVPIVFTSDSWHPGVIGIVASRLVDRLGRPVILISIKDGIGKGSGRSIADFNIYEGLKQCEDLLISYGGHSYAAGISIKEEDIEDFSAMLKEIVYGNNAAVDFCPQTAIDAQCNLSDVNHELLDQIDSLAPFGNMNPEPILCVRDVNVDSAAIVGNNHLKMKVVSNGISRDSIWFSNGNFLPHLSCSRFDILFTPQLNYWNGNAEIQLKMKDVAAQGTSPLS